MADVGSMAYVLSDDDNCTNGWILNIDPIDVKANIDAFSNFHADSGVAFAHSLENYEIIHNILAETNSNRFYLGADAQAKINGLKDLVDNLDKVSDLASYPVNSGMKTILEKYNTKLEIKKNNCKLYLLKQACEKFNNERNVRSTENIGETRSFFRDEGSPTDYINSKYPVGDIVRGGYVIANNSYTTRSVEFDKAAASNHPSWIANIYVSGVTTHYKYIEYKDAGVEDIAELEMELAKNGVESPYNAFKALG